MRSRRHLLTHTSGLIYPHGGRDLGDWARSRGRTTKIWDCTWDSWCAPLKNTPGDSFRVGSGFEWAARVLEARTGMKLRAYMAEHIFRPLGMRDTSFSPSTPDRSYTTTRVRDPKTRFLWMRPVPLPPNPPVDSGGFGLYSTASDLAAILSAILRDGSEEHHSMPRLLEKKTVDEMFRPQLTPLQRKSFLETMLHSRLVPWAEEGYPQEKLDHGISGIINTSDVRGKRRKGSMSWHGMSNEHWWIDRESGIAASLIVNVIPWGDDVVGALLHETEVVIYGELLPSINGECQSSESPDGPGFATSTPPTPEYEAPAHSAEQGASAQKKGWAMTSLYLETTEDDL